MKKRLFSLVLALALCMGLTVPVSAENNALVGRPAPIGTGNVHAYIDTNHSLWTFGINKAGALGNGRQSPTMTSPPEMTPTKVLDDVYSVSVGFHTTYALKQDGSLWVWGNNGTGQLGFEGGNDSDATHAYYVPIQTVPYKLMDDVAAVCHDSDTSAVIKRDGSLWIWGWYLIGNDSYKPQKLTDNVIAASVDTGRLAYVTADHTLWIKEQTDAPIRVMSDVIDTEIGYNYVFAIKSDHSLWAWGKNEKGQLGIGSTEPSDTPVKVMDGVRRVSSDGSRRVAAVKLDNSLWVWGNNYEYQLGTTKTDLKSTSIVNPSKIVWTPTKIMDDVAYADIGPLCAVRTDGSYWSNYLQPNGKLTQVPDVKVVLDESIVSSPTTTPATPSTGTTPAFALFKDIRDSDYFAEAVQWAMEKNITSGTSATTFSPGATCNKAQILTFLWRADGSPEPTAANPFTDIKPADYFYKAALWAAEKGLVSGSTFGANTDCTRAMTMEYMWKAAGSPAASYNGKFNDVPASADYAQAVAWAVENKITSGTGGSNFSPNSTCTCGQIVTFLHRAMGK